MATTSFAVGDTYAVKLWAKMLDVEALKHTEIAPLIGRDAGSIIHEKVETSKGKGDQVTFGLRLQLSGDGFTENELAEGNGEALSIYSDAIVINELGHVVGVKSEETIDAQRVPFDLRAEGRDGLADWYAKRMSVAFFNQVGGYTAQANTKYTGMQAAIAPTTTAGSLRYLAAGSASNDQSITSANTFNLQLIDKAKEMAITATPMVRPINLKGKSDVGDYDQVQRGKYVIFLHPYQITDLRTNTSAGQWLDIQKAAMAGGQITNNPIYSGAVGEYNDVVIRSAFDVCQGVHSTSGAAQTSVRRAVLLGAQAAVMSFGTKNRPGKYRWNEELFDHKRRLEVSAWSLWGLKKTKFNSVDYGTVVVSTYAAAHT